MQIKKNSVWSFYPLFPTMYSNTHTYTHKHSVLKLTVCPASGLITLLPACDPRERLSRVSRTLPLAGGHGDGSTHPFITVTLGRETRGMGCVGELEEEREGRSEGERKVAGEGERKKPGPL